MCHANPYSKVITLLDQVYDVIGYVQIELNIGMESPEFLKKWNDVLASEWPGSLSATRSAWMCVAR